MLTYGGHDKKCYKLPSSFVRGADKKVATLVVCNGDNNLQYLNQFPLNWLKTTVKSWH